MIYADSHCDTLTKVYDGKFSLYKNSLHVDIERLMSLGSCLQFFAIFLEPEIAVSNPLGYTIKAIQHMNDQINIYTDDITLCRNYSDIVETIRKNKVAALLTIEDGSALSGDIRILRMLYEFGVRSICLTWNHRNEIAVGVDDSDINQNLGPDHRQDGLSRFGITVIDEMNRLGMLVDVSHLSERSFWDVAEHCKGPFLASHSNARNVCSHRRNLSNDQLNAIHKSGGLTGINLCPDLLAESGKADITSIIRHIEYLASLTGTECIGLGCDFDGFKELPAGINGVQDIYKIFNELLRLNYPEDAIAGIAGGNLLRVLKEVLRDCNT